MYTTLSGQLGAFKQLEVIANNIANMNTTGFRAERALFEEALVRQHAPVRAGGLKSDISQPQDIQATHYVGIRGTYTDFRQGYVDNTGDPLHVAIQGEGFFVIQTPEGERFTRAGNFQLDPSKRLTTKDGYPVQGNGGDIVINGTEITISGEGEVVVDKEVVGKIRIVTAESEFLQREPGQRFKLAPGGTQQEVTSVQVRQGAVEGSNVNAVQELTDMIMAQRLFDSFQKAQEANSRMNELRNNRLGSTQG